jgi:hypothetical protein
MESRAGEARMIRFHCVCGRELQSPEELVGYSGACPRCGRVRTVPRQSGSSETADTAGIRRAVFGWLRGLMGERSPARGLLTVVGAVVVIGFLVGLFLPKTDHGYRGSYDPSLRGRARNNIKQLGLATINYAANCSALPPAGGPKALHPGLSWRVAILPYIEEDKLYSHFHLDEPWDSPHNSPLLPRMPLVFAVPGTNDSLGRTRYRVFVGKGTAFEKLRLNVRDPGQDPDAQNFRDLAKKVLIIEAENSVPWTKPDELVYDPKGFLPLLSRAAGGPRAILGDGSIRELDPYTPDDELRKLIAGDGKQ